MKLKCISISSHFSSHLVLSIMPSIFHTLKQATCIIQDKRQTELPSAFIPHSPLNLLPAH